MKLMESGQDGAMPQNTLICQVIVLSHVFVTHLTFMNCVSIFSIVMRYHLFNGSSLLLPVLLFVFVYAL